LFFGDQIEIIHKPNHKKGTCIQPRDCSTKSNPLKWFHAKIQRINQFTNFNAPAKKVPSSQRLPLFREEKSFEDKLTYMSTDGTLRVMVYAWFD